MERIKDNLRAFIPLLILLLIGVPLTIRQLREHEEEKVIRKQQRESERVEYFRQPMVWNCGSLKIGYFLEDSFIYVDKEREEITYSVDYETTTDAIRAFDNLFVEICKHHCDSLAPYRFVSKHNREFECSNPGASITLKYEGGNYPKIEIVYRIPQKQGPAEVGEEWEQYIRTQ